MFGRKSVELAIRCCLGAALALTGAAGAAEDNKAVPPSLSAEQIVERNIAARGGLQHWRSLQSMSLSGKLEAGSGSNDRDRLLAMEKAGQGRKAPPINSVAATEKQMLLPFLMEMKRPNKSRVEVEFAGKTAVQVYDGARGWKLRPFLNRNDVEPFTEDEMKAETGKASFLDGPLIDYVAKGTRVALEAAEPVEGHQAYKLKLTLKGGTVQHVWIDAQSFLDVKVEGIPRHMDGKMHDVWVYQRDFRTVDGLLVPFVLETAVDGYATTHKMNIEKVTLNPKLDDAIFSKPSKPSGA